MDETEQNKCQTRVVTSNQIFDNRS